MAINGRTRAGTPTSLVAELPGILTRYAWFHLSLAFVTIGWSILRLRPIALKQSSEVKAVKQRWWQGVRPRVSNAPMLWKEIYIEGPAYGGTMRSWLNLIAFVMLILVSLGSGVYVAALHFDFDRRAVGDWRALREAMNIWFRVAGTSVACLMLLMSAVRASTCITHERERDTLDALVTTPMTAVTMLSAKLLGSLTSGRRMWVWYGSILALAVATGGVHPLAVPLLILAWFVYALAGVMIGLWFSMWCRSSMLATFWTVVTSCFVGGGHWIFLYCCCGSLVGVLALAFQRMFPGVEPPWQVLEYILKFLAGLTPPFVFGYARFRGTSWPGSRRKIVIEGLAFYFIGLTIWLVRVRDHVVFVPGADIPPDHAPHRVDI